MFGVDDTVLYITGAVIVVSGVTWFLTRSRKRPNQPRDTVILHQLSRGPYAPSLSPFVIKLETYLRMAKIPYKNVHGREMSPKGKVPWIEFNGEVVSDSEFCIKYLNKRFNIDLDPELDSSQKGIGRAILKMVEESLYWYLVLARCVYDKEKKIFSMVGLNWLIIKILEYKAKRGTWSHGIGRHTQEEVERIMEKDLSAVSDFLGHKKFLFGDKPCLVDCGVFGQLSQFVWQMPGQAGEKLVQEKYTNLKDYCLRMKEKYWPDWDECTTHGGRKY